MPWRHHLPLVSPYISSSLSHNSDSLSPLITLPLTLLAFIFLLKTPIYTKNIYAFLLLTSYISLILRTATEPNRVRGSFSSSTEANTFFFWTLSHFCFSEKFFSAILAGLWASHSPSTHFPGEHQQGG